GAGFARCVVGKGSTLANASALVVGCGGVGWAIAASLAARGLVELGLYDPIEAMMSGLAGRLGQHYPGVKVLVGSNDPAGWDLVVNATPLGMTAKDPLPFDVSRLTRSTFVGEVVMKSEVPPLLAAARARGCPTQIGTDMLFEQIPAYLEFFGFSTATADELREVAKISY